MPVDAFEIACELSDAPVMTPFLDEFLDLCPRWSFHMELAITSKVGLAHLSKVNNQQCLFMVLSYGRLGSVWSSFFFLPFPSPLLNYCTTRYINKGKGSLYELGPCNMHGKEICEIQGAWGSWHCIMEREEKWRKKLAPLSSASRIVEVEKNMRTSGFTCFGIGWESIRLCSHLKLKSYPLVVGGDH